ncbi:MAG: SDR family oxidoreductase [Gammaproteobacteria bacterium]|nr:SDR family oxidoreductase [Gammaproteobacteria bacterium]
MNIKIENLNLSKKTSIITGGAGHLGMCIADKLSLCGSNLILIDLDEKSLNKAKKKLEKKNRIKVRTFPLDLTNKKERIDCIKLIKKEYKVIDIMVNSIGMVGTDNMKGWNESFENQCYDAWNKAIDTNLTSIFFLIQGIYKIMKKSKNASIINVSSIYGVNAPDWDLYKGTAINNPAAYSVSKAGLIYMTKWLASTLAPNIRVNAVSPGGIERSQEKYFIKKYNKKTLLNRMATESDVSEPVLFLASNMSSYITGQNLIIDGGWTIK